MIEMQKRQVKEIEEKVDICHVEFLRFNVVGHGSMKTDLIFLFELFKITITLVFFSLLLSPFKILLFFFLL